MHDVCVCVRVVCTVYIIYSRHFLRLLIDVNAFASVHVWNQLGSIRDGCRSLAA